MATSRPTWGESRTRSKAFRRGPEPDLIWTHNRDDRHQDHRLAGDLTWNTWRDHLILEYEIPKWDGDLGQPNFYVPLTSATVQRKVDVLLSTFTTQQAKPWFDEATFAACSGCAASSVARRKAMRRPFHARKLGHSSVTSRVRLFPPYHGGVRSLTAKRYLAATLDSLLNQTIDDFVVLVGDNASTDGTAEIIHAYAARDRRVRHVRHPRTSVRRRIIAACAS